MKGDRGDDVKVLFISTEFPPAVGGIGTYAHNLASALLRLGVRVCVLTSVGPRGQERIRNVEVIRTPQVLNRKFLKIVPLLCVALWRCAARRPDKIFAMAWTHEGVTAYLIKKILRIDYSIAAYGSEILLHQRSRFRRALMLRIFRGADVIVACSEFSRRLVLGLRINPGRVVVVHPPIDLPDERSTFDAGSIDEKFDLKGKQVIFTAARLVKRKGHSQVIDLLRDLHGQYPDLVYVMTGEGDHRAELEEIARRNGVADRVRMPGYVSKSEIQQLHQRADVYISLSHQDQDDIEGFGIALIEASACGKPVIAGKSGGVDDAVMDGETGFLVDPLDFEEIKRKLVMLLEDANLRKRLGKIGRARVEMEFGLKKQGEKLIFSFGLK